MNKIETKDQLFDLIFKTIEERRLVYVSLHSVLVMILQGYGHRYFSDYELISSNIPDNNGNFKSIFRISDTYFSGLLEDCSYGIQSCLIESIKVVTTVTKNVTTYE
jgi:hypothetical protein